MLLHVSLSVTDLVSGRDESMDDSQLVKETGNADGETTEEERQLLSKRCDKSVASGDIADFGELVPTFRRWGTVIYTFLKLDFGAK